MDVADYFEVAGEHAVFRLTGHVSLEQAVTLITTAITLTRTEKIRKLLVVTLACTGFQRPGLGARYFFTQQWASAAGGSVRIAMVAKPDMIDRQKFGVAVGKNIGLDSDVFTSEEEALAWLLSR